jgi:hypothetical protein
MDGAGDRQPAGRRGDHRFFCAGLRWQRHPQRRDDRLRRAAHASYVAQIQKTGDAWPDLTRLRLLDPHRFEFTAEPNYLNHPPLFYALPAAIGPKLEGHPQALPAHRLFDVALVAAGLAALLWRSASWRRFRVPSFTLTPCRWCGFRFWCSSAPP